ncbi:MAG: hypothetical protein F4137_12245 [Acidobacteria bacterium]|nr:hypothetical protein [Acidobacteriota bacterium]
MAELQAGSSDGERSGRENAGERERSTISFPYGDLSSAIKIVKGVHGIGGTSCEWEQLSAELGMAPKGGGFRAMALTAKVFGLVTYRKASIHLTDLGARMCDAAQEARARADAFLTVPLYRSLYEKFRTTTLPPDSALEAAMAGLGVVSKQTRKARQAFQRSAEQAGFFKYGKDRLVMPSNGKVEEQPPDNAGGDPGSGERSQDEGGEGSHHDFINGLVRKLPAEGTEWPTADRHTWLQAANAIFDLLYTRPESEAKLVVEIKDSGPAKRD